MIRYRSFSGDVYDAILVERPRRPFERTGHEATAVIDVVVPGCGELVRLDHVTLVDGPSLECGTAWED